MVDDRRRRIEDEILENEKRRGELEGLRMGYEGRLGEINAKAEDVIRKAEADGWRKYEEIVEAGRTEAARVTETSRRQTETEIEEAVLAARGELVGIATDLARKALSTTVTPEVDNRLIEELTRELEQQEWKK